MSQMTIPGIETFHPRSSWEPNGIDGWYGPWLLREYGDLRRDSAFNRTPPPLDISSIEYLAVHYSSAIDLPDGDPGEVLDGPDGVRGLLARSHFDYLSNRTGGGYIRLSDGKKFHGYPLGYSFAFDWLGGVWEINGFDYQPAATSGWNTRALAFLMLTDRADPGSAFMWRSFRAVAAEAQRRGARIAPDRVWPHGKFRAVTGIGTPTACCGPALTAQIDAGLGDWTRDHTGDDDMNTLARPRRAYDSRTDPRGPLAAGETREVVLGAVTEAFVNITAISQSTATGFISVNDPAAQTSIVNYSNADRVEANTGPVLAPGGRITITNTGGPTHVAVDVMAQKP